MGAHKNVDSKNRPREKRKDVNGQALSDRRTDKLTHLRKTKKAEKGKRRERGEKKRGMKREKTEGDRGRDVRQREIGRDT